MLLNCKAVVLRVIGFYRRIYLRIIQAAIAGIGILVSLSVLK